MPLGARYSRPIPGNARIPSSPVDRAVAGKFRFT